MKSILLLLVTLLLVTDSSMAQVLCKDKKMPYRVCFGGTTKIVCSDDPNDITKTEGLPVLKARVPCIKINGSEWDQATWPNGVKTQVNTGDVSVLFHHPTTSSVPLEKAIGAGNSWSGLCGVSTPENSECCIEIRLSSNPDHFENPLLNDYRIGFGKYLNNTTSCEDPCSLGQKPFAYINFTQDFMGTAAGPPGFPAYTFYTNELEWWKNPRTVYISFENTIQQILAQWYGFPTVGEGQEKLCDYEDGVAFNSDFNGPVQPQERTQPLSEDDKCWYRKLYCPHTLSVDVQQRRINFEVMPNPSRTFFDVRIPDWTGSVELEVIDVLGKRMKHQLYEQSIEYLRVETQDLASGKYFIRVSTKEGISTQIITVLK